MFFEPLLLKNILQYHYFYFEKWEKKQIEENCYHIIQTDDKENFKFRREEIWSPVFHYLSDEKSMILEGFVRFRLPDYEETLEEIVDFAVNQFIIEKEYTEFINLLKVYIDSKEPQTKLVHLIYTNGESILLDENKNVIVLDDYIFNAQYLSDISFSSNDFALNTLLTLLPKKIEVHLISREDEFIHTLKLIFSNRISICTDCNICKTYRVLNNVR